MKRTPLRRKKPMQRKARATKAKVTTVKTLRNKADKLAGEFFRARGQCAALGYVARDGLVLLCSGRMEWAHRKSRGNLAIRHHPRNADCLCNTHHRFFTENPDEFTVFVETIDPGAWDFLQGILKGRREGVKQTLREIYEEAIDYYTENSNNERRAA